MPDAFPLEEPKLHAHDVESWFQTIWAALHAGQEAEGNLGTPENTEEWNDICTAMAWLKEQVEIKDELLSKLIRYNSEQVVRRRVLQAKLNIATEAMQSAEDNVTHFLLHNLVNDEPFENIPELDEARSTLQDAEEAISKIKPSDYGRP